MASEPDIDSSETKSKFEAYSNYARQSERVAQSVEDAVSAYTRIRAAHQEGAPFHPKLAAEARSDIESAALRLESEMKSEREDNEVYDEILSDWEGEEGYLRQFTSLSLVEETPGWLWEFVTQIRRAAFERGYLSAGRTTKESAKSPVEEEPLSMFREE